MALSAQALAAFIEQSRNEKGWSPAATHERIADACRRLNLDPPSENAVSRWRNGTRLPNDEYRLALADVFGWTSRDLAAVQTMAGEARIAHVAG